MRLRRSCKHDRYEQHRALTDDKQSGFLCPGGEFLPEDALVIEKVDGEWPLRILGAMAGTYYDVTRRSGLLADVFKAQLDALVMEGTE